MLNEPGPGSQPWCQAAGGTRCPLCFSFTVPRFSLDGRLKRGHRNGVHRGIRQRVQNHCGQCRGAEGLVSPWEVQSWILVQPQPSSSAKGTGERGTTCFFAPPEGDALDAPLRGGRGAVTGGRCSRRHVSSLCPCLRGRLTGMEERGWLLSPRDQLQPTSSTPKFAAYGS